MSGNRWLLGAGLAVGTAFAVLLAILGAAGSFLGVLVDWKPALEGLGVHFEPDTAAAIVHWVIGIAIILVQWIFAIALMYRWRMLPGQTPATVAPPPAELQQLETLKEQHGQAKDQIVADRAKSQVRVEQLERQIATLQQDNKRLRQESVASAKRRTVSEKAQARAAWQGAVDQLIKECELGLPLEARKRWMERVYEAFKNYLVEATGNRLGTDIYGPICIFYQNDGESGDEARARCIRYLQSKRDTISETEIR